MRQSQVYGLGYESFGITSRVVAPGAGVAIATLAGNLFVNAGAYDVQVILQYDGAVAAAELNNMQFQKGATVISALLIPAVAGVVQVARVFRVAPDGATAVSVNAVGIGTAGVGYTAQLLATRIA